MRLLVDEATDPTSSSKNLVSSFPSSLASPAVSPLVSPVAAPSVPVPSASPPPLLLFV